MGRKGTQQECSEDLGIPIRTLATWCKNGLPYRRGIQDGRVRELDYAEVLKWARDDAAAQGGEHLDSRYEKARLDKERADAQALKNEQERGDLIRLSPVVKWFEGAVTELRQRLLALPTACAPRVIGHTSMPKIEAEIEDELHSAMSGFTRDSAIEAISRIAGTSAAGAAERLGLGGQAPEAKPRGKRGARKVADRKGTVPARDDGRAERP